MKMRGLTAALAAIAIACLGTITMAAAEYPDRAIKIVVPFPPGGTSDTVARLVANGLSERLRQTVLVENKGGGGTMIGTQSVARSAPDGYTLLWLSPPFAVNPSLQDKAGYDPIKDFAPIAMIAAVPLALIVPEKSPYASLADLVAAAKANPGKLNYGSSGYGGSPHLATELFATMEGIKLSHVPYQGSAPAVTDLIAGQTDLVFDTVFLTYPQVKGGKARALAQTGPGRSPMMPDVPTMKEAGLPTYTVTSWFGLAAPAGTPPAIIDSLNAAVNEVLKSKALQENLAKQGVDILGGSVAEATAHVASEVKRWETVVRAASARVQ